jgi:hypothetical protein
MNVTDANQQSLREDLAASTAASALPPPTIKPVRISIADACSFGCMSRSELYRRLAAGQIQAIKSGARTLILLDSLQQHLASLPPAKFGTPTNLS